MIATLLLATVASTGLDVDLFLVANNDRPIENLDWLDSNKPGSPMEQKLFKAMDLLTRQKKPFVLVVGGKHSAWDREKPTVVVLQRSFEEYVSASETFEERGVTKSRAVAKSHARGTSKSTLTLERYGVHGGYSRVFMHFDESPRPALAVQDLNSYKNFLTHGHPKDKARNDLPFIFSMESLRSTEEILRNDMPTFNGIAICAWGRPLPGVNNLVGLPSEGVVTHCRLRIDAGKMSVSIVGYIR